MTTYIKDALWDEAKQVMRHQGMSNSWVDIVTYYHAKGGCHTVVHGIIAEKQWQLLYKLDSSNVLLRDAQGNDIVETYENVTQCRKLFFYVKNDAQEKELILPPGETYNGNQIIKTRAV